MFNEALRDSKGFRALSLVGHVVKKASLAPKRKPASPKLDWRAFSFVRKTYIYGVFFCEALSLAHLKR